MNWVKWVLVLGAAPLLAAQKVTVQPSKASSLILAQLMTAIKDEIPEVECQGQACGPASAIQEASCTFHILRPSTKEAARTDKGNNLQCTFKAGSNSGTLTLHLESVLIDGWGNAANEKASQFEDAFATRLFQAFRHAYTEHKVQSPLFDESLMVGPDGFTITEHSVMNYLSPGYDVGPIALSCREYAKIDKVYKTSCVIGEEAGEGE